MQNHIVDLSTEEAKAKLREWGIENPTRWAVDKLTRRARIDEGMCSTTTITMWKYPEGVLSDIVERAVNLYDDQREAIRRAERAFHGARTTDDVLSQLL